MDIKLTEIVRVATITLKVNDAPLTALPLIKEAFAKLATDLEEVWKPHYAAVDAHFAERDALLEKSASDVMQPVSEVGGMNVVLVDEIPPSDPETHSAEPAKRRGRPPKAQKVGESVEPTPLEQAIRESLEGHVDTAKIDDAVTEDKEPQGDRSTGISPAFGAGYAKEDKEPQGETPATSADTPTTEVLSSASAAAPITDRDMNSYLADVCNKSKNPADYRTKVYEMAKPFVEEGAVARPSNIKGDDKRWQFIKAVEADSGVKYHG